MAITVGGTNITMNDSTVQATAFVGGRGQVFTAGAGQTFTIPAGITALKVTVQAAGGGSGKSYSGCFVAGTSGGGGGGGCGISFLTGLTPGATISVTVGSGGAGSTTNTTAGTGGSSSISSGTQTITTITATGGAGGASGVGTSGASGVGGSCSGATLNLRGGGNPVTGNASGFNNGGASFFSLGPPRSSGADVGGTAGTVGSGAAGGNATNSPAGVNGAAGGDGVVVFEW